MMLTEAVNDSINVKRLTHLTHIEDNLLYGPDAAVLVLQFLKDMFEFLEGHTSQIRTSYKVDGSPSVMVASDFNGKAFVTTKSGEKKAATTPEEVELFYGKEDNSTADLVNKLKIILRYAPVMNIPKNEIWQGDFLFSEGDVDINTIDGEELAMFNTNTLWFAFPMTDPLASKILKSKIGIAFHTVYKGTSWDNLKISFGCDIDRLQSHPEIYYMNTSIPSVAGKVTMTQEETNTSKELLKKVFEEIKNLCENPKFLNKYEEFCLPYDRNDTSLSKEELAVRSATSNLIKSLQTYKNKLVRAGVRDLNTTHLSEYIESIKKEGAEKRASYSRKGDIERNLAKENLVLDVINYYAELIIKIWEAQTLIADLKDIYLSKMNPLVGWRHYTKGVTTGFMPVGGEGFVISDVYGNVMKIVSRMEFSRNNFSNEIIKGWTSSKREAQYKIKEFLSK